MNIIYRFITEINDEFVYSYMNLTNRILKKKHSIGFIEDLDFEFTKNFLNLKIQTPKSALLSASIGNKLIGTGYISPSGFDTTQHYGNISKMMVDVDKRGKGIGKEILKKLEEKAIEIGYTHIKLDTWDIPYVVQFYKKCGYKVVGKIPEYVKYKEEMHDSHIFCKKLN